jgi:PAS domain-containing protein
LTKWSADEATGQPLSEVYQIFDAGTGAALDRLGVFADSRDSPDGSGHFVALVREGILISRDGSRAPVEENWAPTHYDAGRIAGGVLVFRDITSRKRAEAAQRANEEQLRTLANTISHLAWMAEADGNVI